MSPSRSPLTAFFSAGPSGAEGSKGGGLAPAMFNHMLRKHGILEDASPDGVHEPKVELRASVALLGGHPVPARRFGVIPLPRPCTRS